LPFISLVYAGNVGFDKLLCVVDLNTTDCLVQSIELDGVIGSVKWPICNQSLCGLVLEACHHLLFFFSDVCVSVTLDNGTYLLFDIRQGIARPAFRATMGKRVLLLFLSCVDDLFCTLVFGLR
jgi:hypothetical protein